MTYRPNPAGVARLLKTFGPLVDTHTEKIATEARSAKPEADIVTESYVTDRSAGQVIVREPQAIYWQVRDGHLVRAAAAAGLEVRSYG